jgi:hypothetical protein
MIALAKGGASSAFYWNPEEERGTECAGCLWTPTDTAGGGAKLPMYDLVARFGKEFRPGTEYKKVSVDKPDVRVLATDKAVLVVNTLDRQTGAEIDGEKVELQAYEVKWLKR